MNTKLARASFYGLVALAVVLPLATDSVPGPTGTTASGSRFAVIEPNRGQFDAGALEPTHAQRRGSPERPEKNPPTRIPSTAADPEDARPGTPFRGDYRLSVDSDGGAAQPLAPTSSVDGVPWNR